MNHDFPEAHAQGTGPAALPSVDEMTDTAEEQRRWPALQEALALCEDTVNKVYRTADTEAQRCQRHHNLITRLAALCGTVAVLLAILQLSSFAGEYGFLQVSVEFIAALIALFAVVLGLVAAFQRRYLLERHKAERYRLLKFGFLIDPALHGDHETGGKRRMERLSRDIVEVAAQTHQGLDTWVSREDVPRMPSETSASQHTLSSLVEYYLLKRLNQQITYFSQASRHIRGEHIIRQLPVWLFFVSVLCAFAHFALAIYERGEASKAHANVSTEHGFVGELLIVLAASLPVIGAGIRTLHTASERRRNTIRFQAKAFALDRLRQELARERDAAAIFRLLWQCEQIMDAEHREWLRLMIEAEWFG